MGASIGFLGLALLVVAIVTHILSIVRFVSVWAMEDGVSLRVKFLQQDLHGVDVFGVHQAFGLVGR